MFTCIVVTCPMMKHILRASQWIALFMSAVLIFTNTLRTQITLGEYRSWYKSYYIVTPSIRNFGNEQPSGENHAEARHSGTGMVISSLLRFYIYYVFNSSPSQPSSRVNYWKATSEYACINIALLHFIQQTSTNTRGLKQRSYTQYSPRLIRELAPTRNRANGLRFAFARCALRTFFPHNILN